MVFKCEEVLKNIASSIFYLEFNYKEKKLEKIEFIKLRSYTDWKKEDFTPDFIQKNMLDDYEKSIRMLMELANGKKSVEIVHKFVSRSGKIIFLKAKVTLIEKDDTKIYCVGINENITREKEYEIIFNTLKNSSNVGIIIFRDKILYANPYICSVLNIECQEIANLSLIDLISNVSDKEIYDYIKQRKEGTQFYSFRENVEFVFNEKRFFFNSYTSTVMYKGEFAGMSILVDVTKIVKREIFGKIIDEVSEHVIKYSSKKKFFNKLIEAIEKNGYKVYLKYNNDFKYGNEIAVKSKDKKILVNGSYIYIPFENGEIVISSKFKNEFDKTLLDEYRKLKKLIEYASNHIRQTMLLNILKEAIEKSYQWVLMTDENGKILYANDVVEELSGYK